MRRQLRGRPQPDAAVGAMLGRDPRRRKQRIRIGVAIGGGDIHPGLPMPVFRCGQAFALREIGWFRQSVRARQTAPIGRRQASESLPLNSCTSYGGAQRLCKYWRASASGAAALSAGTLLKPMKIIGNFSSSNIVAALYTMAHALLSSLLD